MSRPAEIVVPGAYGFTGAMIVAKLAVRGIFPVLAGKDIEKLKALQDTLGGQNEILQIDVTQDHQLQKLDSFSIIVNCAGPFNLLGKPVLEYSITTGKTYLDICGEQAFIEYSFREFEGRIKPGGRVVHSLAFESCMADLLATDINASAKIFSDISSFYYFENASYSRGSRYSMQVMKHFPSSIYGENEFVRATTMSLSRTPPALFPANMTALFVPYPEVFFFARRFRTRSAGTWYVMDSDEAAYSRSAAGQPGKDLEALKRKYQNPASYGPDTAERQKQIFRLVVQATSEKEISTVEVSGHDTYDLSAEIMTEAICLLLNQSVPMGYLTPAELFNGVDMLGLLAEKCGLEVTTAVSDIVS